ncbi:TRAP transporter large permease [Acuticoccus sp. M5D2P5]|uniref:TRAP transporter large permease n=1 Tax=Acuticoccus kalidii TaxID=2910977 RepID=UPI001F360FC5|nr:TRAP transporter large permease [Acuticoccus kalidii]MCF3936217.1 TRAP transporter large permease [Acuticoccus kalidii]
MTSAVAVFVVLILIGTPIALVMVMSGLAGGWELGGIRFLQIISERMFSGVSGYLLMAIPYFIFTSELMNQAGLTERLVAFNNALLGRIRGALSHVNIVVSLFFSGLTGAAITDTVAVGKILIPAMKKEGYTPAYSAAVTACSSIIGPIIPPSVVMVVYAAILRNVSVLDLFAAGILPGVLMAVSLLVASGVMAWVKKFPRHGDTNLKAAAKAFLPTVPALLVPVIILGGILGGFTTITEASAFAAMYTMILGFVFYRTLTLHKIWLALIATVRFSGVVFFLLAASTVLGWFVTRSGIARDAADMITSVSDNWIIQIMLVNLLLILLGTVLDVLPALVVVAPVLVPAMVQLGFDPLHFAIVMIITLNVANITPPVGMTLMTASQIAGVSYERAILTSLPFYLSHLAVIVIVSLWPAFVLFIPNLLD